MRRTCRILLVLGVLALGFAAFLTRQRIIRVARKLALPKGGSSVTGFGAIDPHSRFRCADYGARLVDATDTSLAFRFGTRSGRIVDEYALAHGTKERAGRGNRGPRQSPVDPARGGPECCEAGA